MKRVLFLLLAAVSVVGSAAEPTKEEVLGAMKCATQYMMDSIGYRGGFVWSYLLDKSRCWGEIEARPHMMWLQSTGTPDMGELMIDAYHATGDEYYYEAALTIAGALMEAQHPSGGWNYVYDFDGEESLKEWYRTVGASAWRLEEFQHYYGNATFDDECTTNAASFLLRLYLEKHDANVLATVEKAIDFVLQSQYPCGGWPQRYPLMYDHPFQGKADYSSFVTLNDGVQMNNVAFLQKCARALERPELEEAARKGMYLLIDLQQPEPLAGWADQYTTDLKPAHARSYEPRSVNTGTTVSTIRYLFQYYRQTGNKRFLEGIPRALEFMERVRLTEDEARKWGRPLRDPQSFFVPRFLDPDNGMPLYVHRVGGNVCNGHYYTDQDITHTISHYSSVSSVNVDFLRTQLQQLEAIPAETVKEEAERLRQAPVFSTYSMVSARPFAHSSGADGIRSSLSAERILSSMSEKGCWVTDLRTTSNPYLPCDGLQPSEETAYGNTLVGDRYDTSPYNCDGHIPCISLQVFVNNMGRLVGIVSSWDNNNDDSTLRQLR